MTKRTTAEITMDKLSSLNSKVIDTQPLEVKLLMYICVGRGYIYTTITQIGTLVHSEHTQCSVHFRWLGVSGWVRPTYQYQRVICEAGRCREA